MEIINNQYSESFRNACCSAEVTVRFTWGLRYRDPRGPSKDLLEAVATDIVHSCMENEGIILDDVTVRDTNWEEV